MTTTAVHQAGLLVLVAPEDQVVNISQAGLLALVANRPDIGVEQFGLLVIREAALERTVFRSEAFRVG